MNSRPSVGGVAKMQSYQRQREKLFAKYERMSMDDTYVIFVEFSNIGTFYQFVDYTYGDKICEAIHRHYRLNPFAEDYHRFQHNQYVFIGHFGKNKCPSQTEKEEQIAKRIQELHHQFFKTFPLTEDIILTYGGACNGIKKESKTIKSLIQMAQYTMVEAKKKQMTSQVADEIIRSQKTDLDDFVLAFDYYFDISEFTPFFQPIVDKDTLRIVGCESLIRWKKDEYRIISANRFKDIALEKKYFDVIDKSVIRKSFEMYNHWRDERLIHSSFVMVINLSYHTLSLVNIDDLLKLTIYFDILPENIEFDIDDFISHNPVVYNKVIELKASGFKVAVDAFQYQRLSMSSFLHFDVDTIKIDKSILPSDIPTFRHIRLYKAILDMAGTLKSKTLIKGIENKQQMEMARDLSVDYLQGYYFTKPIDEEAFRLYLKKHAEGFQTQETTLGY
jgi:EAL domain-containing protein (putative c-di-GMP-specific phosphodiesterase class I)